MLAVPQRHCTGTQNKETGHEELLATTIFSLLTFIKCFHNEHILLKKEIFECCGFNSSLRNTAKPRGSKRGKVPIWSQRTKLLERNEIKTPEPGWNYY